MSKSDLPKEAYVPSRRRPTDFPVIDEDPHFSRVLRYMRPSDYAWGATFTAFGPAFIYGLEQVSPTYVKGTGGLAPIMRLSGAIGLGAGFLYAYQRSNLRFLGLTENTREIDLDMREMVAKVKRGEPLYGKSQLSTDQQAMAARNSKYNAFFLNIIPWPNFVNHPHHGVDTAKYYQQAERELEQEGGSK